MLALRFRLKCQMPGASQRKIITRANAYITPPACQAPWDTVRVSTNPSVYILNSQECCPGLEQGWRCSANGWVGGYQGVGKKPRLGPFLSQGIRDCSPGFTPGLSRLEQVRLGLSVHNWAKRTNGTSPTPRKRSGSTGTLPPTSPTWPGFSPPAGQGHKPKLATQATLLKIHIHTHAIF